MTTAVIIVAAGSGSRLGSRIPKAFVQVAGATLLEHAVGITESWEHPHTLIVVAPPGWEIPARDVLLPHTPLVVTGGDTRTHSVQAGLAALGPGITQVLVHDVARTLMPTSVFDRVVAALTAGATGAVPELPIVDTLVEVNRTSMVTGNAVDRSALGAVQTPQGFSAPEFIAAHQGATGDFTDDTAVFRRAGHEVIAVAGDATGFKITHPADLQRAAQVLSPTRTHRVGTATDAHRFDAETPLWLAGLHWPGEPGLHGHSDGDVVIHAIVDALLQAAGLGDIGTHFGSDRPEFAGASSHVFLESARALVKDAGYAVDSVGVQVIANAPKLGPRRDEAQRVLSALVGAPVTLGATTSDGMGFPGRGEGAVAIATAVLISA